MTRQRLAKVGFDTWGTVRYPTADGRELEIATGQLRGSLSLRFEYRDPQEQPIDVIACEFHICDRDGRTWAATSRFTTQFFVTHMFDLSREGAISLFRLPPEGRKYREQFMNHTVEHYRRQFERSLLLLDARYFSDDRGYRTLAVGKRLARIKFKYLHLHLDVAAARSENDVENGFADWFSVRIKSDCFWDEDREDAIGSLAYDISCVHFLRHNTAVFDEVENRWRDNPIPMQLVFCQIDQTGMPQPNVRLIDQIDG